MKAFEVVAGSQSLDGLVETQRPKPEPGPGEVLVRIRAASMNFRDLAIVNGQYFSGPLQANTIPLSDGAGEIESVGGGVGDFAVGDRVIATFSQGGTMATLGSPLDGVLTEYAVFNPAGLRKIPDALSFEAASTLPCAGATAWNALMEGRTIRAGDTVLVLGTGGVSIMALQIAKAAGARVIVTSSSDTKLERAQSLGADLTVNYRTHPDWSQRVLELTGGAGADQIVEVGGAGTLPQSYLCVADGGEIALIGVLSAPDGNLAPHPLMVKGATLRGIFVGRTPELSGLLQAIACNGIEPVVDRVFDFEDARQAFDHMQGARHFGKIVIRI